MPGVPDSLGEILGATAAASNPAERVSIDREAIYELLEQTFPGLPALHADLEIIVLEHSARTVPVDPFALRVGSWRLDLPKTLLQSSLATAVLAGAISIGGPASVPVAVLAVVLPFLVDMERVEVRTRDRIVLAALRRTIPAEEHDVARLYEELPDDLRHQLTLLEFADTLDRLRLAGEFEGPAISATASDSGVSQPAIIRVELPEPKGPDPSAL